MSRSNLSPHHFFTRVGAIAILVLVLALGVTAFDFAPHHQLVPAAVQITPVSAALLSQFPAPSEQKVSFGSGYWLVTNPETGQFIRVERSTNPSSVNPLTDPSNLSQTPVEQKVNIDNGYWLVTNAENGHFIRVELAPR